MAYTKTLAQLRTASQQRADMENSNFITDAEWLTMINDSYGDFYDLIIVEFDGDYVYSTDSISIVSGTATYALPTAHYKTLGVDILVNGEYRPLKRYRFNDRNDKPGTSGRNLRYRLQGSNLAFIETPTTSETVKHIYAPMPTALATDTDTYDFYGPGWNEYLVCDVAIKAKEKEESSTISLERRKEEQKQRIIDAAKMRDASEPEEVLDVENNYPDEIYFDSYYTYI